MSEPVNPYAPSQSPLPQLAAGSPFAPRTWAPPYQSAQGKARVVVVLTIVLIALQLVFAGSSYLQIKLLQTAQGGQLNPAAAQANDVRQQGIAVLTVLVGLVNLVALLIWIYGAHRNLPALGAENLDFTPGWAVGWFFIPFMNLFKPCQALFELWKESDPARLPAAVQPRPLPKSAAVVGWWWGLRIAAAITGQVVGAASANENTIEGLITVSWVVIVLTFLMDIPTDLCQILMVRGVQDSQAERHRLVKAAASQQSATGQSLDNPWATFQ